MFAKERSMGKQLDERPPLQRALDAVAGLKVGSWESVEALALLAIEAKGHAECASLRDAAHTAAAGLKSGTWESVRALACLARADREIAGK
jgi:hypothetical protein